jgi:hypothetical protein
MSCSAFFSTFGRAQTAISRPEMSMVAPPCAGASVSPVIAGGRAHDAEGHRQVQVGDGPYHCSSGIFWMTLPQM